MALGYPTVKPTFVTLVVLDEAGDESHLVYPIRVSAWSAATGLLADLYTIRDAIVTAFNAVSDSTIDSVLTTIAQRNDPKALGAANSEIENIANVVCELETFGKPPAVVKIPAPNIGIFLGTTGEDKNQIDKNDAALLTYLGLFQETGGTVTISDGEQLSDAAAFILSGKRVHRGSRRG